MTSPVYFLIAGEASGDILGARLMRALRRQLRGNVVFRGIGGPQMIAEGLDALFPYTELMHFGLIEVVRHIPRLLRRIRQTADEIIQTRPAALITIDSPDFCFRVAKRVKRALKADVPLIHYVAPTVWAWRPGRAKKISRFLDHLLAVLPFEPPYFTRVGLDCTFVGHSVVEGDAAHGSNAIFRAQRNISPSKVLVTLLPGSREGEITRLLPLFKDTIKILLGAHPDLHIIVPTVRHLSERVANEIATWDVPFHMVEGERAKYDAFAASCAALACSGTVALELALAGLPAVIVYKMNRFTVALFRHFVRIRFANLVNIMHNKMVVPELLQDSATPENCARSLGALLTDQSLRDTQKHHLAKVASWLGHGEFIPSERASETIIAIVERRHGSMILPPNADATAPREAKIAILQIVPALVTGGVERGTVETTAALTTAGFRAFVASSGGPMVKEIENAGGTHILLPLQSKNPFVMYQNISRLKSIVGEHHINLIHARSRAPAWSAYAAARSAQIPFVTTFHSAYGARSRLKRLYNSVMAKGEQVIAISDFVAEYAKRVYAVSPSRLHIIPRGVDLDVFDPRLVTPERVEALRQMWNLTPQTPIILMPGRLTRWKGQSLLVEALAMLKHRRFMCLVVGGGKDSAYGKELAHDIKEKHLDKNIALLDTCRDMAAAYALATVVVVPSLRPEGFGRVVIEAQAMGIPVVASDHGGAVETVVDGVTGWLTRPGDAAALAHRMTQILDMTSPERAALAAASLAHIRRHFTTQTMTSRTLEVYKIALGAPPSNGLI